MRSFHSPGRSLVYGRRAMCATSHPAASLACIEVLRRGVIPPTLNYRTPDPACNLDIVANEPRESDLQYILSNAFGFGGINSCVVLGKVDCE